MLPQDVLPQIIYHIFSHTPREYQDTRSLLMFSGGTGKEQWPDNRTECENRNDKLIVSTFSFLEKDFV